MYTNDDILKISNTTTDFYNQVASSFSSTRQHEWDGWKVCKPYINSFNPQSIMDVACGNLRFEKYINYDKKIYAIDNCFELAQLGCIDKVDFIELDIIKSLILDSLPSISCDISVCFGFMHHIPGYETRLKFINWLMKSSNVAIISLWQFANDKKLLQKSESTTNQASKKLSISLKEKGDYFLGWKNKTDVYRFCHSFSDDEIDHIAHDLNLCIIDSFKRDKYNKYLIFKS